MTNEELIAKGLLCKVSVSMWGNTAKDKDESEKVRSANGASEGSVRVNKTLLQSDKFKRLAELVRECRAAVYRSTLPWDDSGRRLCPVLAYNHLHAKVDDYRHKFDAMVKDIKDEYYILVDAARVTLGQLFNADDYPSADEFACKFKFVWTAEPIPDPNDIRVTMPENEKKMLTESLKEQMRDNVAVAKKDIVERISDAVGHMVEKLSVFDPSKSGKDRGTFRDTLVTNVTELVDNLATLNFDNNQTVEDIRVKLMGALKDVTAKELRESEDKRKNVLEEAKSVMFMLSDYAS